MGLLRVLTASETHLTVWDTQGDPSTPKPIQEPFWRFLWWFLRWGKTDIKSDSPNPHFQRPGESQFLEGLLITLKGVELFCAGSEPIPTVFFHSNIVLRQFIDLGLPFVV